ncbi:metalloregulator ArsR/SmtB family transcription factor [Micromonospora sp. NPDC002717]|uniref:ArsR/SmtB family transcription factor n=1 Tax=Micromonospora sp. NPDC002717 TaxID=3154424 RepID=UPI0033252942
MASDDLSRILAALADPTRRAILARLVSGEASVTELAAPFAMSMPAVSRHLRVLERAGLVGRRQDAQRRPCRLDTRPLEVAAAWLGGIIADADATPAAARAKRDAPVSDPRQRTAK